MKKETSIAIVLGIALGIIVAVALVLKNRQVQIQNSRPITTVLSITPTPIVKNINVEALEITEPQNNAIISSNSVSIKGKVAKDSLVVIQSPIRNVIVKNAPEDLNVNFPLALGENVIHITVYPKDPQLSVKEKELKIYYLNEQ